MKKLLIGAFVAMVALASNASYLYWSVNSEYEMQNTGNTYQYSESGGDYTYELGHIMAYKTGSDISTAVSISGDYGYTEAGGSQRSYSVDVSSYSDGTYSFFIELMAYDSEKDTYNQVALTSSKTYADLVSDKVIYDSSSLTPIAQSTWHGGGEMNAPEPTSAMLMLLGVAGLALKRKQRKQNEV